MSVSQDRRVWLGGGVLAAVLLILASWFLLISPKMSDTSSLKAQTADAELQNGLLTSKVAKLKKQEENIASLQSQLGTSLLALPSDSGLAAFTRQLTKQSSDNSLDLVSVVVTGISQTAANGVITASGGNSGSPAGKLYAIPVTVIVDGSVKGELDFLHAIQVQGPRAALVNSTSFMPPGGGAAGSTLARGAEMTVQVTLYSAPKTPAEEAQLEKDVAAAASNTTNS